MGRCENGFDSARSCQCDSMCKYYKSCCSDYEVTCAMMSEFKQTNKPWTTHSLVVFRKRRPLTRHRFSPASLKLEETASCSQTKTTMASH